jgi:type I restriction enzyme M protein
MAIKKSELYSSLWSACDELRGGMDASQYKDYVLVILFIKYVSDKYVGEVYAPITIPEGSSFNDMINLKGKESIGDDINKKIIAPLADANKLSSMPDFNDSEKLGSGKEMVEKLTNLIAIFEDPQLDFGKNRAEGDDILGDAYEYLMRHFAAESGKSKGQFYTPAEVSRIMAKIIGIDKANTTTSTTVYDPTCGSGSLLLKISDVANSDITLYGQEKDSATSALAKMNMILHDNPTAEIVRENTLSQPLFINNDGSLKSFDYVVANPPFSDKKWSTGIDIENDKYRRFNGYGTPPNKNGDYAYLLHIIRSLKSQGKGACILPHGVLFRGNTEADIRENIIRKGYIKAVIGLPTNLFYGTGIPACIILIDKENAINRQGIFMIDASKGFIKAGNKNRLREMDIHRIVDVFEKQIEIDGYSKLTSYAEIEKNVFNLNIPRYIDSSEVDDLQDIEAHLLGDIPKRDIHELQNYWEVFSTLKNELFKTAKRSDKYASLQVEINQIKKTIHQHPDFVGYMREMSSVFLSWKSSAEEKLISLEKGLSPKSVIHDISEELLSAYSNKPLINKYDVYQHLMSYWIEVMQDDCYIIAGDGWNSNTHRVLVKATSGKNKGNKVDKGWDCDLIPKKLVINRYFVNEQNFIDKLNIELENLDLRKVEIEEEHGGEDGAFSELEKINKTTINRRLKEIKIDPDNKDEKDFLNYYLELLNLEAKTKKSIKEQNIKLDNSLIEFYPSLTEEKIKELVVKDKWLKVIEKNINSEMDQINQHLTQRIKELAERYETPLPIQTKETKTLESVVSDHLQKMGFVWN